MSTCAKFVLNKILPFGLCMCVIKGVSVCISCTGKTKNWQFISCVVWATHTHPFNGPLSGTTQVSRYKKGKTKLDFTEARDSEWQWNPLGHMQVCTSLQTDNHASTSPLNFLQAGCLSCRPTNSVRALKAGPTTHRPNFCVCLEQWHTRWMPVGTDGHYRGSLNWCCHQDI